MQCKALKSFDSKPLRQHIRAGMTFNCEPRYGQELAKNKLVEIVSAPNDAGPGMSAPGPSSNKRIPAAPGQKTGNDQAPPPPSGPAPAPAGGQVQRSQSSQAAPASPAKTVTTSSAGGRRGVATPRRKSSVVTKKGTVATSIPAK